MAESSLPFDAALREPQGPEPFGPERRRREYGRGVADPEPVEGSIIEGCFRGQIDFTLVFEFELSFLFTDKNRQCRSLGKMKGLVGTERDHSENKIS